MESYVKELEEAILQYVGSPVLNRLKADPTNALKLGGKLVDATMLFMDLRSIPQSSKNVLPDKLLDNLNIYFEKMSEIIIRCNGFVDSLRGDTIFAVFGISNNRHADDACNAAIECLRSLDEFNMRLDSRSKFSVGIGINSGKVILGNIGSKYKLKFTAVGDNVNLAARMESETAKYQCPILLTEYTKQLLTMEFNIKELERISVKGLEGQLIVYSLQA
jgi:adenylate cyclase